MTNDFKDALALIEAVIEGRSEMYVAGVKSPYLKLPVHVPGTPILPTGYYRN